MGHTLKLAAIGAIAFMVLDGIWLGMLMKSFYRDQLAPIVRLADGAMLGLVVYGVYDFTNYSTLRQWPLVLAFADVAWGVVASAMCAVAVKIVVR